jgi:hypothetical protein
MPRIPAFFSFPLPPPLPFHSIYHFSLLISSPFLDDLIKTNIKSIIAAFSVAARLIKEWEDGRREEKRAQNGLESFALQSQPPSLQ